MSPMPFEARPRIEPQPVLAPPAQLDEVATLLARSVEPIIITEYGGRTEGEAAALIGLAEVLAAPIFEFIMPAYHNAPRTHPLVMPGTVEPVLERADAIVVAGSNAPWSPPSSALRPGCAVIHLEEDPLRPRATGTGRPTRWRATAGPASAVTQTRAVSASVSATERAGRWAA
jgi:acetolactate synthase-1/2/3 large subunit